MGEVFTTEDVQTITVVINGTESQVEVDHGTTLRDFVITQAREAGIRTFSVYLDGQKMTTEQAGQDLSNAEKVEIVAKDARGC